MADTTNNNTTAIAEAEARAKAQANTGAQTTTTEEPGFFSQLWDGISSWFCNSWIGRLFGLADDQKKTEQNTQTPQNIASAQPSDRTMQQAQASQQVQQNYSGGSLPRSQYSQPRQHTPASSAPAEIDPQKFQAETIAAACKADIEFDQKKKDLIDKYNKLTSSKEKTDNEEQLISLEKKQAEIEEQFVALANQQRAAGIQLDKSMAEYEKEHGEEALSRIAGVKERQEKLERQKNSPLYTASTATDLSDKKSKELLSSKANDELMMEAKAVEKICYDYKRTTDFYDETGRMVAISLSVAEKDAFRRAQVTAGDKQATRMPEFNHLLGEFSQKYGQANLDKIPTFQCIKTDEQRRATAKENTNNDESEKKTSDIASGKRTGSTGSDSVTQNSETKKAGDDNKSVASVSVAAPRKTTDSPVTDAATGVSLKSTLANAQTQKETPLLIQRDNMHVA